MLRRLALCAFCVFLLIPATPAQQPPLAVILSATGDPAGAIDAFVARIGASTRYSLLKSKADMLHTPMALVFVVMKCVNLKLRSDQTVGYACSMELTVYPALMGGLNESLQGDIVTCGTDTAETCGEDMFEDFVSATQPDQVSSAQERLQKSIDTYIQYEHLSRDAKPRSRP